jgi:hypothetical protein
LEIRELSDGVNSAGEAPTPSTSFGSQDASAGGNILESQDYVKLTLAFSFTFPVLLPRRKKQPIAVGGPDKLPVVLRQPFWNDATIGFRL